MFVFIYNLIITRFQKVNCTSYIVHIILYITLAITMNSCKNVDVMRIKIWNGACDLYGFDLQSVDEMLNDICAL
jgi:hypothetical protein